MDDRETEKRLKTAMEHMTPDIKDALMAEISSMEKPRRVLFFKRKAKRLVTVAACLLICLSFFTGHLYMEARAVDSLISLDVNPGIVIEVNKKDRVIDVRALNDEGQKIIGDMDLKNTDLNVAVNALVGSMAANGYIDGLANSILVSVENEDPLRNAQLQNHMAGLISGIFEGREDFSVAVLSQSAGGQEARDFASRYGVSPGKAQLALKVSELSPSYSAEQMAELSVNDLNLLIASNRGKIEDSVAVGAASDTAYIGASAALDRALADAEVTWDDIYSADEKLDYDEGLMIYEVSFETAEGEYEYKIDALSGAIIEKETEVKSGGGQEDRPQIGAEKAWQTAMEDAGKDSVQAGKVELEDEDGRRVYEIDFVSGGVSHEYKVDASTGEILERETEEEGDSESDYDEDEDEDEDED